MAQPFTTPPTEAAPPRTRDRNRTRPTPEAALPQNEKHICPSGTHPTDGGVAKRPDVIRERGVLSWLFTVVRNQCVRMLRPSVRERHHLGERADAEGEADVRMLDVERSLERFQL